MEVRQEKLPDSRVAIDVTISPEEMEDFIKKAVQQLSMSTKIKGFRPGKANREMIENALGKDVVFKEAVDLAIRESFVSAIAEKGVETISPPKIDVKKMAPGNPLVYRAEVTVIPTVELKDYSKVRVEKKEVKVEEKEVADVLKNLQKSRATYSSVKRTAQKGDRVEIDFTTMSRGVLIEGGESKQHPLVIGEGHFMSGFEDELVGLKENEEKSFSLSAPSDYYRKELAGRKLDFKVKLNMIQEMTLPELNDEFAADVGKFSDLNSLKTSVAEGLTREKEAREKERRRIKIIEEIVKLASFEVPSELVKSELEKMEGEFTASLTRMNLSPDDYLAHIKKSMDDLKKEWGEQAEKRVRSALVLREIARREGIEVAEADVEARANEILKSAPPGQSEQKINIQSLKDYVRGIVRNEKVLEMLEMKAGQ